MSTPKHAPQQAHEPRTVAVEWEDTTTLVEYVPANIRKRRFKKVEARAIRAAERQDGRQAHLAMIDWLAEMLTGWDHKDDSGNPMKPTRATLTLQPVGWLQAAVRTVGSDLNVAATEFKF